MGGEGKGDVSVLPKKGAVYIDADGTLRRRQLILDVVEEAAKEHEPAQRVMDELNAAKRAYEERSGPYLALNELVIKHVYYGEFFDGMSVARMEVISRNVIQRHGRHVHFFTRELATAALEVGMHRAIISGSLSEVVKLLAAEYGIHIYLGTEMEIENGAYTGKVRKAWVEDKKEAVHILAGRHEIDLECSVAIGDTRGDIPMLAEVRYPICINPKDEVLVATAREKRWTIVLEKGETHFVFRPDEQGVLREVPLSDALPHPLASILEKRLAALYRG